MLTPRTMEPIISPHGNGIALCREMRSGRPGLRINTAVGLKTHLKAAPLANSIHLLELSSSDDSKSMGESVQLPLTMETAGKFASDVSTVNYESQNEKENSDLQLLWSSIMDEGNYANSSTYTKVEVLLLCWAESCNDITTEDEVNQLKTTFEEKFYYNTHIEYLDTTMEGRLQVRVNKIVADFVADHDGPNTLLIVYYAGHGRPGENYGDLELMGSVQDGNCGSQLLNLCRQITANAPQNQHKRLGDLVWNKTEKLLLPAEADVLEIFDWSVPSDCDEIITEATLQLLRRTIESYDKRPEVSRRVLCRYQSGR